jgi:hypothetical protein
MKYKSETDPALLPSWKKEILRAFGIKPPEPIEVVILKGLLKFRGCRLKPIQMNFARIGAF